MAALRQGGVETLLQTHGRAELETGTPQSIQGQLEPEPYGCCDYTILKVGHCINSY